MVLILRQLEAYERSSINISNHTSDLINNTILKQSDLVVTLCSHADAHCPTMPSGVKKEHWGFDDRKYGSAFQRVRDDIKNAIEQFKYKT